MCLLQTTEVFTGGLSDEGMGKPYQRAASQEEKQLCCPVANIQYNCVSFCVDTPWYQNDCCHSGLHLLMHMALGAETDPVPSFFITGKCYGSVIFPVWLAEFMTEAAHTLLPVWMPPFSFVRGGWHMLETLLCAVFAELQGLWTQQTAMHPGLLCATRGSGSPNERTGAMICVQTNRQFFASVSWRRYALLCEVLISLRRDFPHSDKHHSRARQSHRTQTKSLKSLLLTLSGFAWSKRFARILTRHTAFLSTSFLWGFILIINLIRSCHPGDTPYGVSVRTIHKV